MPRADVNYNISATDKSKSAIASVKKGFGGLQSSASSLTGGLKGLLGIASGVAFTAMIKGAVDAGDELSKMSIQLGISVEQLSRFQYVAERSGIQVNAFNIGLQRMERRLAQVANTGTGEAAAALDRLGLSAVKLKNLAPDQQFLALADALKGVEDPAERLELAFKFFDSEGVKMLRSMENGAAGIQAMMDKSDELGATLSATAAQDMVAVNDALATMGASFTGVRNVIAVQVAPALESMANFLGDTLPGAVDFTTKAFNLVAAGALIMASKVASGVAYIYEVLANIPGKLGDFYQGIAENLRTFEENAGGAAGLLIAEIVAQGGLLNELNVDIAENARIATEAIDPIKQYTGAINDLALATGESNKKTAEAKGKTKETANAFGAASSALVKLQETNAGKQKGIFKALFAASKAFAIADAVVQIQGGIAKAANNPFPANLAAMAGVVAATASIISTISGTNMGGARAIGGGVEGGRSYLVGERGPELFTPGASGQISANSKLGMSGSEIVINNYAGAEVKTQTDGRRVIIDLIRDTVSGDILRGGSSIPNAVEGAYAMNRGAGARR